MLKSFRYLLLPLSFFYAIAVRIRNWLFDKNHFKSSDFNFPIICVGNLAIGGTGKTPMVEYLIRMLGDHYTVATLSRGYKRKTKGYGIANENTTALEIGDEPMQFHQKFPDITVAVGEDRLDAIPQLLHDRPDTRIIILDDAFQHRTVRAGLNILLTDHINLYTRDLLLPAGDLRDSRKSAERANVIIVTKCPQHLSIEDRDLVTAEINPKSDQSVFFTHILYGTPYHLFSQEPFHFTKRVELLLVCGIADPRNLQEFVSTRVKSYDLLRFPDHHIFSIDDMEEIKKQFGKLASASKVIVTTEKDAVRLKKFENELKAFPIYVMPIEHAFLFEEGARFDELVKDFVESYDAIPLSGSPEDLENMN